MSFSKNKRVVIKVGSALIAPDNNGCSTKYLNDIAKFIHHCHQQGQQVVLVSSGSVAAGKQSFPNNNQSKATRKAMAAAGQNAMMATWGQLINVPVAQILLTHADLCDRERYVSIKETIESLLEHNVLPVINENDTVTSEELKVGDNDNLSAMTAAAVDADALVICTDVDGLFDKNPHRYTDALLQKEIAEITPDVYAIAGEAISSMGTGGMRTKIEAAQKAVEHGIHTYIINGFKADSFKQLQENINPGTHFLPSDTPLSPAIHWMTHTVRERGEVIVNDEEYGFNGDEQALTSDNILSIKGRFAVGDTILVANEDGTKIVKAKTNFSSCMLNYATETSDEARIKKKLHPQHKSIISEEHLAKMS